MWLVAPIRDGVALSCKTHELRALVYPEYSFNLPTPTSPK